MASTDTFLNLSQGLAGNIDKATNSMESFNDIGSKLNKSFEKTNKNLNSTNDISQQVNDSFDDITESTENNTKETGKWRDALGKLSGVATRLGGIFASLFVGASFFDAIGDTFELHQAMTDLSYRMGDAGQSAGQLNQAIIDTQLATGIASERVLEMVTSLGYMRVASKDMQQLATDGLNFAKITGATDSQVSALIGGLSKMGGLGADSISSIMGSMVQVQRQFGMSTESVNALSGSIVETTKTLRTLGKSSADVEKFQSGAIKLAGAFESVGLEAQGAMEIIDRLLDPGKLEDNALLYSKLGISMSDAISGNINPEDVMQGLQGIGAELSDMAGPQAAALAQSMGMSLTQLRQMSEMDVSQISEQFGMAADASGMMANAQDDQATATQNMKETWEKIKGTLGNIVEKFMPVFDTLATLLANSMDGVLGSVNGLISGGGLDKIADKMAGWITKAVEFGKSLFGFLSKIDPKMLLVGIGALVVGLLMLKKKFASVSTDSSKNMRKDFESTSKDISKSLEEGVSGGLAMAAEKSAEILTTKLSIAAKLTGEEYRRRVAEGHQHGAIEARESYQELLAGQDTFSWAKKLNQSTSEWLGKVKEGGKPVSLLDEMYGNIQGKLIDNYNKSRDQYNNELNFLDQRRQKNKDDLSQIERRRSELESMDRELSAAENRELDFLGKRKKELSAQDAIEKKRIEDLDALRTKSQMKNLKLIGPNERAQLRENAQMRIDDINTQIANQQKMNDKTRTELDLMKSVQEATNKQYGDLIAKQKAGGKLTADEAVRLNELSRQRKENIQIQEELNNQISQGDQELKQLEVTAKDINSEFDMISEAAGDLDFNESGNRFKSIFGKATSVIGAKLNETFIGSIGNFGEKLTKSISNTKAAFKDAFNADGIKGALRLGARSLASGAGSLVKNVTKAGAGLAKKIGGAGISLAKKAGGGLISAGKAVGKRIARSARDAGEKIKDSLKNFGKGALKLGAIAGGALLAGAFAKSEKGQEVLQQIQEKIGQVFEKFAPAIEKVMQQIMPIVDSLMEKLSPLVDKILVAIMPLIDNLMSAIGPILDIFQKNVVPILEMVMGTIIDVIGKAMDSLIPIVNTIMSAIAPLVDVIIKTLAPIFKTIMSSVMPIIETFVNVVGRILQTLAEKLMPIFKSLISSLMPVIDVLISSFMPIIETLIDAIMPLVDGLLSGIGPVLELLAPLIANLVRQAMPPLLRILAFLGDGVAMLLRFLGTMMVTIGGWVESLISSLADLVYNIVDIFKSKDKAEEAVAGIRQLATTIGSTLEGIGEGLTGAADGLNTAADAMRESADYMDSVNNRVLGKATQTWDSVRSSFKDELQAASGLTRGEMQSKTLGELADYLRENDRVQAVQQANASVLNDAASGFGFEQAVSELFNENGRFQGSYDSEMFEGTLGENLKKMLQDSGGVWTEEIGSEINNVLLNNQTAMETFQNRGDEITADKLRGNLKYRATQSGLDQELIDQIENMSTQQLLSGRGISGMDNEGWQAMLLSSLNALGGDYAGLTDHLAEIERNTGNTDDNTDPSAANGITTELYPSIIEATSSGFVESQRAYASVSGGNPEERAAAAAEVQVNLLRELVTSMNQNNEIGAERMAAIQAAIRDGNAQGALALLNQSE